MANHQSTSQNMPDNHLSSPNSYIHISQLPPGLSTFFLSNPEIQPKTFHDTPHPPSINPPHIPIINLPQVPSIETLHPPDINNPHPYGINTHPMSGFSTIHPPINTPYPSSGMTLSNEDIQSIKNSYGLPLPQSVLDFFNKYAIANHASLPDNLEYVPPLSEFTSNNLPTTNMGQQMNAFVMKKSTKNSLPDEGNKEDNPKYGVHFHPPINVVQHKHPQGKETIKLKLNIKPKEDGMSF